jgi:hypothetical protein
MNIISNVHRQHNFMFLVFIRATGFGLYFDHHSGPFHFFFSSFRPVACYSSASLHPFIGRPRLLFPSGILSCTFLTSRSSAILDMCTLHSVLLLCTHDVMFWIPHVSRMLSFLILSLRVLFIILLSVFISVTSNICTVFAVSVRVSAA